MFSWYVKISHCTLEEVWLFGYWFQENDPIKIIFQLFNLFRYVTWHNKSVSYNTIVTSFNVLIESKIHSGFAKQNIFLNYYYYYFLFPGASYHETLIIQNKDLGLFSLIPSYNINNRFDTNYVLLFSSHNTHTHVCSNC